MDGAFACPKCGYELKAKGLVAGRQVRCDWCEAWVEVPFLPRVPRPARRGRGTQRLPMWLVGAWGTIGVLAAVLLTVAVTRWMHATVNVVQEQRMAGLLASADEAEKSGRLGDAVAELEAALVLMRSLGPTSSARFEALTARRDALARREVRGQLETLDQMPPDKVIGTCLVLLARVREQPALAEFEESIREHLQAAALRSVTADLEAARAKLEAGQLAEVQGLCEHVAGVVDHVDGRPRRQAIDEARGLVTQIASVAGAVLEPLTGQFTFGAPAAYTSALQPSLIKALHQHGYLTCPTGSIWRDTWETAAPYRVSLVVDEKFTENYMQSQNRVSLLNATVALRHKETTVWEQLTSARTQVPVPKITGYQGARLGVGDAPIPEYERVLYNNAHASFLDRFGRSLDYLPDRGKTTQSEPPGLIVPGKPA